MMAGDMRIGPSMDELKLFLVDKGISVVGIADCEHVGRQSPGHLLAAACARSNLSTLLIDFSAAATDRSLPVWGRTDPTDRGPDSQPHLVHMKGGLDQSALYGNPAHVRTALAGSKSGFRLVICATDPVLGPLSNPAHMSVLSACEGVLLRAISGVDAIDHVAAASQRLRATGATIVGCIFDASDVPPLSDELGRWARRIPLLSRMIPT